MSERLMVDEEVMHAQANEIASLRADLAGAREEVARLTKERESLHARFLDWRGVEEDDACQACDGSGSRAYANTAVWRGGIGGQAITRAVCDKCWGSGSKSRPWLSHRQALAAFTAERSTEARLSQAERVVEAARELVASSCWYTRQSPWSEVTTGTLDALRSRLAEREGR